MEGSSTFFSQLRSLCAHVDSRVTSLKQDCGRGPGRNPEKYDQGLGKLKGDVRELKKQSQDIQDKLTSLSRFSGYLKGAQELVEEQIAATHKMEQYCAQYGYVIPKVDTNTTPEIKVTTPEEDTTTHCEKSRDECAASLQVTPEISVSAQMVMQGKGVPLLTPARKATTTCSNLFPESPAAPKTPSASKIPITTTTTTPITPFTPGPKPFMMMEQWMATTGEDSFTPATSNTTSPWESEPPATQDKTQATPSTHSLQTPVNIKQDTSVCHSMLTDSCNISHSMITPPEPTLSALSTQMLMHTLYQRKVGSDSCKTQNTQNTTTITTPEEPILYSQHNSFVSVKNNYDGTPEEPVLHYKDTDLQATQHKETPEEPVLSYQENMPFGWKSSVPEEPVLSYHHKTPTAATQNHTYRRTRDATMFSPHTEMIDEVPCTPELSDRTMSLLSLIQQAPSQHNHNHQEQHTKYQQQQQQQHHNYQEQHTKNNHHHLQQQQHEDSYSNLHGLSQPQWNHHGASQPHRNLVGMSQLHRDHQEACHPHHLTKPRHSFSAAMNKLNQTKDENTLDIPGTQQHWSSSSSSSSVRDKGQREVDPCQTGTTPPSPQLSDITQRILGQLRR